VGSEIWPQTPDMFFKYNDKITYKERINEIVKWFFKFQMDFVTMYFNEPDSSGHFYGPLSIEYANKV
jgi:ectonucleotide pyrophosphatase/phosphodiesterase family protein 5